MKIGILAIIVTIFLFFLGYLFSIRQKRKEMEIEHFKKIREKAEGFVYKINFYFANTGFEETLGEYIGNYPYNELESIDIIFERKSVSCISKFFIRRSFVNLIKEYEKIKSFHHYDNEKFNKKYKKKFISALSKVKIF